jgi:hypothetical protein
MAQNRVKAVTRGSLAGSSLTSSYQAINSTPFGGACFRIAISNSTTAAVDISYDGSTDHDVVLTGQTIVIDAQTNAQPTADTALFMKGLTVYVKGASSAGSVYVSGYYVTYS